MNPMEASFGRSRHLTATHRGGDRVLSGGATIEFGTSTSISGYQLLTADDVALTLRVRTSLVGMGAWRMSLRLRLASDAYTTLAPGAGVSGFEGMRIKYKATPGDPGREVGTVKRAWVDDGYLYGESECGDPAWEAQVETQWGPFAGLPEGEDQPPSSGQSEC
ncbi:MAG TPA: hypothetical protein VGL78_12905 [Solirubrobacteraceae bacterium]|jgi:hypothetical protein